ncbi:unnamed protein product [Linum tenue]|uniref:TF-B3 domain-containing protein n=1 Tax=Linum tenue TaxID=586396 RepID=A0AAV0L817_9ROSI|nr:unnamed protein product [Linum tenue]
MESFGMKDGSQMKSTSTTFGLIRRGNASDMEKMKPHFFRVMLDFMLKDAKIYIPTEFAKKYRSRLGSHATLKVANGDTWEVELATDDDGLIWLVKGWEDFTKHHTLKQGDIVVFRLEQDSLFLVMVFDPTASEKRYNFKHVNEFERQFNDVKVEEGIDVGKEKGHREGQKNVGTGRIAEVDGKHKQVKNKKGGAEEKRKGKLASLVEAPNHPMGAKNRALYAAMDLQKQVQEDDSVMPEFADDEEEELYDFLNLELQSDLKDNLMRHYEVVYLIHEKHAEEVDAVNEKVQDFLREKKGKIWRMNDWGMRRLAYKIQKAKNAHYILMNFEIEARWINEFKTMLDQDERIIQHLSSEEGETPELIRDSTINVLNIL